MFLNRLGLGRPAQRKPCPMHQNGVPDFLPSWRLNSSDRSSSSGNTAAATSWRAMRAATATGSRYSAALRLPCRLFRLLCGLDAARLGDAVARLIETLLQRNQLTL